MGSNEGQVRYVDGKSEHLVETEDGIPTKKRIWEVTRGSIDSFGSLAGFLSPSTNYRFMPNGEGEFTFQSNAGMHLVSGYTKDGRKKGVKDYPTWGTVWVEKSSHAIRKFIEYMKALEKGENTGLEVGAPAGSAGPTAGPGIDTPGAGIPTSAASNFPGGAPTGLEVDADLDADLDAAKSSQISRQQGPPPTAAPQPPLSAVRTSPKRNALFKDTPTDYVGGGGGGSENRPLKRYGYKTYVPASFTARLPIKNQANDRLAFWWFVAMALVGAFVAAFAGSFFGNFLRGKAK